jgi:transposase
LAQDAGWRVEASAHAETLFTGFAGPGGGIDGGRSLAPRCCEDIQRERPHGRRWSQRFGATGSAAALAMGRRRPHRLAGRRDWLLARIAEKPDLILRAVRAELATGGVKVSYGALWAFFAHEGITFKKRACTPANGTAPTSPAGASGGRNTRAGLTPNAWSSSPDKILRPPRRE